MLTRLEDQIGRDEVAGLAAMLLEETPDRLAEIHRTLAAGDAAAARRMAHDIASTAGNLGITEVATLAQALERKYNEGAYDDLQPIAAQMDSAYSAAAVQLKARYRLPGPDRRYRRFDYSNASINARAVLRSSVSNLPVA